MGMCQFFQNADVEKYVSVLKKMIEKYITF